MNRNLLIHSAWGAVTVACFAFSPLGGNRAGDAPASPLAGGDGGAAGAALHRAREASLSAAPGAAGAETASSLGRGGSASNPVLRLIGDKADRPPLSDADIAELGEQMLTDPNPMRRHLAFNRLLAGLTPENAEAIRAYVGKLPHDSQQFRDFHYAWGAVAGSEAVLHGKETRERDMATTLAGWASADPGAARAWLESLGSGDGYDLNDLRMGLVAGLLDIDRTAAANYVLGLGEAGDPQASRMMSSVASEMLRYEGLDASIAWSENLPEGALRYAAMDRVANSWVARDPQGAAEWAEQFAGEPSGARVVEEVADEWAERDPQSSVGWLLTLEQGEGRQWGMRSAFDEWARRDSMAASEYLVAMPASADRDAGISGLVNRIARNDPQAAIAWAGEIGSATTRERALVQAGQSLARRDRDAAAAWVATSGLSAEAQQRVLSDNRG